MNIERFLQENQENLNNILRPFQQELKRGQRLADFLQQCVRCLERNDYLQLEELLHSKAAENVESEEALSECRPLFETLREYTKAQVEKYRFEFIEDLSRRAEEADLPIAVDFPNRTTTINKKVLKSIDPRSIVTAALRWKKQLYDRPFDPQAFVDSLYATYIKINQQEDAALGHPVAIQQFYLEYVISLQSKAFFTNMDKSKFRGYSLEQFGVDLWRYFAAGIGGTSNGMMLQLRPGRNNSLWLIDSDGERRQITGISFQERAI